MIWREEDHPRVPSGTSKGGEFTHGQAGGKEAAGQHGPGDGTEVPSYGTPVEGAVEADAVHYSTSPRQVLLSEFYGTGERGAERDRLADADPSIRQRTYFYIDEGNGVQPEMGVGSHAHRVTLRNLYDPSKDKFAVWRSGRDASHVTEAQQINASELAVRRAGYDGFYIRQRLRTSGGGWFGVAVLLGSHAVPVKYVGTGSLHSGKTVSQSPVEKMAADHQRFTYAGKKS